MLFKCFFFFFYIEVNAQYCLIFHEKNIAIAFLPFAFILSSLVRQNTINAATTLRSLYFSKTVIKMSARYGENEWGTRDGDFKMKKSSPPPLPPKIRTPFAKERDRNFSTTTKVPSSRFPNEIARSSPSELSAKTEGKGGRNQSLLINETSDSRPDGERLEKRADSRAEGVLNFRIYLIPHNVDTSFSDSSFRTRAA